MRVTTVVSHATNNRVVAGIRLALNVLSQAASAIIVDRKVKSGFRLFKNEADFNYLKSYQAGSVLAQETALAAKTEGKVWASKIVSLLCIDAKGELEDNCERD